MKAQSIILGLLLQLTTNFGWSQTSLIEHYYINNFLINPAITGIEKYIDIQAGYRRQWTHLDGAPANAYLTIHSPFGSKNGKKMGFTHESEERGSYYSLSNFRYKSHHGAGLTFRSESIGPFESIELKASYAYHLPLSSRWMLTTGISVGTIGHQLNQNKVITSLSDDQLVTGFSNGYSPLLNLGILLYSKSFYLGGSYIKNPGKIYNRRNYYLISGMRFRDAFQVWTFNPFVIFRNSAGFINFDFGIKAQWQSWLWFGANYRTNKAFSYFTGFNLNPQMGFSILHNIRFKDHTDSNQSTYEMAVQIRLNNIHQVLCPQEMW
ncbi:MAG: PorP/SprF family type IX secretion system membrane protein [Reichenbachiella sp.]|uniref:PorP/SprF family type IX secretion system membrane protein n=1 Tax=Reichenbachiella sp. TaxID=2184521 RepID=UPI0032670746